VVCPLRGHGTAPRHGPTRGEVQRPQMAHAASLEHVEGTSRAVACPQLGGKAWPGGRCVQRQRT
jgi:hypothetical protein